jgi:hypothetical protein
MFKAIRLLLIAGLLIYVGMLLENQRLQHTHLMQTTMTNGAKIGYLMAILDLKLMRGPYDGAEAVLIDKNKQHIMASDYLFTNYEEGGFNGNQIEQDINTMIKKIKEIQRLQK